MNIEAIGNRLLDTAHAKLRVGLTCAALIINVAPAQAQEAPDSVTGAEPIEQVSSCVDPSQEAKDAVDRLIAAPLDTSAFTAYVSSQERLSTQLMTLDAQETATPEGTQEYLHKASAILAPYNVAFGTNADELRASEGTIAPPELTQLDEIGRNEIKSVVTGIYQLPIDYVALSGLRQVNAYRDTTDEYQAYVRREQPGVAFLNVARPNKSRNIAHEIYHEFDFQDCPDDIRIDPAYTAIDGPDNVYDSPDDNKVLGLIANHDMLVAYDTKLTKAANHRNYQKYQQLLGMKRGMLNAMNVISPYSFKDAAEDKAEIASLFSNPSTLLVDVSPATPIIFNKMKFLLARIYERSPSAAASLVRYSTRVNADFHSDAYDTEDRYKSIVKDKFADTLSKRLLRKNAKKECGRIYKEKICVTRSSAGVIAIKESTT